MNEDMKTSLHEEGLDNTYNELMRSSFTTFLLLSEVEEDRFLKLLLLDLLSCFSLPPPKCIGELRKNLTKTSFKH